MSEVPKVSVVLSAYNEERYLGAALVFFVFPKRERESELFTKYQLEDRVGE